MARKPLSISIPLPLRRRKLLDAAVRDMRRFYPLKAGTGTKTWTRETLLTALMDDTVHGLSNWPFNYDPRSKTERRADDARRRREDRQRAEKAIRPERVPQRNRPTRGQAAVDRLEEIVLELSNNWDAIRSGLDGIKRAAVTAGQRKHLRQVGDILQALGHNVWLTALDAGHPRASAIRAQRKAAARLAKKGGVA